MTKNGSLAGASVDGVSATEVARPTSLGELATFLAEPDAHRRHVVATGNRTKLDWGLPPEKLDVLVELAAMNQIIEHRPGDLVVQVQAGMALADLQQQLAASGQCLGIDEVIPNSSIGGIIATGLSGPSRLLFGAVRDLLIGLTFVRADGTVVRSGGRVVKNVAGYDLCKLLTGSYGTLGVIADATFRLHPLPEARAFLQASYTEDSDAERALRDLTRSQAVPTAIEAHRTTDGLQLAVGLEGTATGVVVRTEMITSILGPSTTTSSSTPSWWARLPGATTLKLTVPIATGIGLLTEIDAALSDLGAAAEIVGSAGLGIYYAGFGTDSSAELVAQCVSLLRDACARRAGACVVLRAPAEVKSRADVWGPVKGFELMAGIKKGFDPDRRLSPGRFVKGL